MKHKAFVAVFVLAIALGVVGVFVQTKEATRSSPVTKAVTSADRLARPLASYRVVETSTTAQQIDYRGANYKATVSETGFVFGQVPELNSRTATREFSLGFGSPRLEQGSVRLECSNGRFNRAAFGVGQILYSAVTEEYLFENRRVEQLFRIQEPLASGDLRVSFPVITDLKGTVVTRSAHNDAFTDMKFKNGGLEFCDESGKPKVAYYGAVAIDARARKWHSPPDSRMAKSSLTCLAISWHARLIPWSSTLGLISRVRV